MGKSRRKPSGGSMSQQELRRYGLFLSVPLFILVLAAVLLAAGFVREKAHETGAGSEAGKNQAGSVSEQDVVIEPDTKEYHYNFGGSILEKDAHHEINQLMEEYFRCVSSCDMEPFMDLFTSQDTSQEEQFRQSFEKQREYIEGYENISCYTADGLTEDSYVVYVSYDVKFSGVNTLAPSLIAVYAEKCSDGKWRIFDGEPGPELSAYLDAVAANEDVVLLAKQVDEAKEKAAAADVALQSRLLFMENGPSYMEESMTEEENASDIGEP